VDTDDLDNRDAYWDDLFEWFDGECSTERAAAIERWVQSDPEIARRVEIERTYWNRLKRGVSPLERTDSLSSLQRLQTRRESLEQARVGHDHPVASIVPPRRVGLWGSASLMRLARIAAAVLVVVGGSVWLAKTRGFDVDMGRTLTSDYVAARGERVHITLPDGSHVTLAPESRLSYTAGQHRGPRVVTLVGRAYFDVIHKADRPFSVHAGTTETEDVGTRFLVEAYPGDVQVRVAVATGEVAVRGGATVDAAVIHLIGGESAVVNGGTVVSKGHDASVADYSAWAEGAYRLRDAPLVQVATELSRWYDLDVQVDSALRTQRLSITIGGEPPEQLLATIARATNARYTRHANVIVLRPR
jgi:transmembrane sensor